jgi:hypothetical protein
MAPLQLPSSVASSANPLEWGTWTFATLIILFVLLRFAIPASIGWRARLAREVFLVAPAALFYFLVRGLVDARPAEAFAHAEALIRLEQSLGIFHERDLQAMIVRSDFLVDLANWIYIWTHWPVITATLVWLIIFHRLKYPVYRNVMLLSGAVGMAVFALFPVAPPRLMPGLDVVDTVTIHSYSYRVLQPPDLTNPFAAMPSLHLGWNLLMGIAIFRETRRFGFKLLGVLMPLGMFLAIVFTANHYILDGLVGGLLILLSFLAVTKLTLPRSYLARVRRHVPPSVLSGPTEPETSIES